MGSLSTPLPSTSPAEPRMTCTLHLIARVDYRLFWVTHSNKKKKMSASSAGTERNIMAAETRKVVMTIGFGLCFRRREAEDLIQSEVPLLCYRDKYVHVPSLYWENMSFMFWTTGWLFFFFLWPLNAKYCSSAMSTITCRCFRCDIYGKWERVLVASYGSQHGHRQANGANRREQRLTSQTHSDFILRSSRGYTPLNLYIANTLPPH